MRSGGLILCITVAAVALGAVLPEAISGFQDQKNESRVQTYEDSGTKFSSTANLVDSIKILNYGCTLVSLDREKDWIHSEEEIQEICSAFLTALYANGVTETEGVLDAESLQCSVSLAMAGTDEEAAQAYLQYADRYGVTDYFYDAARDEQSFLSANRPQTDSAVVWRCSFFDQTDHRYTVWIDDTGGKVIAFERVRSQSEESSSPLVAEDSSQDGGVEFDPWLMLDHTRSFLKDYYGFTGADEYLLTDYLISTAAGTSEDRQQADLFTPSQLDEDMGILDLICLTDADGSLFYNHLEFENGRIAFNFGLAE